MDLRGWSKASRASPHQIEITKVFLRNLKSLRFFSDEGSNEMGQVASNYTKEANKKGKKNFSSYKLILNFN